MINKQWIAVDFDGVISRTSDLVLECYQKVIDPSTTMQTLPHTFRTVLSDLHLQRKYFQKFSKKVNNCPLLDGVKNSLTILNIKYNIIILTARSSYMEDKTKEYLWNNKIPFDKIVCGNDINKREWCQKYSCKYLIDDTPETANDAADVVERVFLFPNPQERRGLVLKKNVLKINGWDDIIRVEEVRVTENLVLSEIKEIRNNV